MNEFFFLTTLVENLKFWRYLNICILHKNMHVVQSKCNDKDIFGLMPFSFKNISRLGHYTENVNCLMHNKGVNRYEFQFLFSLKSFVFNN